MRRGGAPARSRRPSRRDLLPLDEVGERLERVLQASPADETELVWLEISRRLAANRGRPRAQRPPHERTILIRVIDHGRLGSHRTGAAEIGELDNAVRQAVAQSRVREPLPGLPHLPADPTEVRLPEGMWDADLAGLGRRQAEGRLKKLAGRSARMRLEWGEARVAVFNSRGLRRRVEVTGASLEVRIGDGPGAGRATTAARRRSEVALSSTLERAGGRHAGGEAEAPPAEAVPLVLSPEATIGLVELLNRVSFSASAYHDGSSFLREHLGVQVFDRRINLCDDGTDARGLPFPFDLEGTAKHRVDLIVDGSPKTPALDQRQAALLGLPPTGHAIGGSDARAEHLFLQPGELGDDELLAAADGGLWVGWLDSLECLAPQRVNVRAVMRGVRRIEGGRLGPAVPDLVWEDSLLRAFSNLAGIGRQPLLGGLDGFLGGISAPPIALNEVSGLVEVP